MDQLVLPFPRGTGKLLNPIRGRDRSLQLFSVNQEFPVGASHQLASITSLPFVHTARRYYRSNDFARYLDWHLPGRRPSGRTERRVCRERDQAWSFRGSKSRNKVSVGEPAEGSLPIVGKCPTVTANPSEALGVVLEVGGRQATRPSSRGPRVFFVVL